MRIYGGLRLRLIRPTNPSTLPVIRRRCLEFLAEFRQFVGAEIADRPVVQAAVAPAADVVALEGFGPGGVMLHVRGLRHKKINDMGAALVDDGADSPGIDIIEPAADQIGRASCRERVCLSV